MGHERVYPPELASSEAAWVRRRRRLAGLDGAGPGVGFALSGGGIRSATFCLGVFQALAGRRLVRRIDWLSTVSGGGYFGGFLGALFLPDSDRKPGHTPVPPTARRRVQTVETTLGDSSSGPVNWLRQNGRYLSPAGAGDALLAVALQLRNFFAIHAIIGLAALSILLAGLAARPALALVGMATSSGGDASVWGEGGAGLPWSPWVRLALAPLLVVAVPSAWAYWLTPRKRRGRLDLAPLLTTVLVVLLCLVSELSNVRPAFDAFLGWPTTWPLRALGSLAALALLLWIWFDWRHRADAKADLEYFLLRVRNRLSRLTKTGGVIAVVLLAFGLADTLGQSLYEAIVRHGGWAVLTTPSVWSPLAAVLAVVGALRRFVGVLPAGGRLRVPWQAAAWVAAALVATVLATVWAATAHAFVWAGALPHLALPYGRAAVGATAALALSWGLGRALQFVNNSSHHAMYAARLTRAYLGASNPDRRRAEAARVTDVIPGDAVPSHAYRPHAYGGPLHVVNVTLNETIGGRDQIEYRDRKGLGVALGPTGLSIGASHHGLWNLETQKAGDGGLGPQLLVRRLPRGATRFHPLFHAGEERHPVQSRQVGHWLAISGAAFTTGLGARTSLPLALLLGLANVRLGYWWDSHVTPGRRDQEAAPRPIRRFMRIVEQAFPVQTNLFDECLARFWGPAKTYWYLSDGGHFENTGCYELLRRRVPIIVCCDCGADPDYAWADLANLVRKARTDLAAEIRLLANDELLDQLRPDRGHGICEADEIIAPARRPGSRDGNRGDAIARWAAGHAVAAYVNYLDDDDARRRYDADPRAMAPDSVVLFLKPSLTGDEPADVLEYARSHPSFPHEPTIDQYFDEAQWESYRRLGQHVAEELFGEGDAWFPIRNGQAPTAS